MMKSNKYLAEFLGTLLLGLSALISGGNALVVGATLALAIFFTATISFGHLNPAISLMIYFKGGLSNIDLLGYIVSQCLGGVLAFYLFKTFA